MELTAGAVEYHANAVEGSPRWPSR
jgi:hypothetical protein